MMLDRTVPLFLLFSAALFSVGSLLSVHTHTLIFFKETLFPSRTHMLGSIYEIHMLAGDQSLLQCILGRLSINIHTNTQTNTSDDRKHPHTRELSMHHIEFFTEGHVRVSSVFVCAERGR